MSCGSISTGGTGTVESWSTVAGISTRNDRDVPSTAIRLTKFMPMMILGMDDAVRTLVIGL